MAERPRKLVLLIEDSEPDAELIRSTWKDLDPPCDFIVARTGDEAIRIILHEPPYADAPRPDLVLLDLNIPGTDGREVLAVVRQQPSLGRLPVVVLTTSESPTDINEAYRLHANTYLAKPGDYKRFVAAMRCVHEYWFRVATLPKHPRA